MESPPDDAGDCQIVDVEPDVPIKNGRFVRHRHACGASSAGVLESIEKLDEQIDSIAVGRAPTKPATYGAIRVSFCDGEGIAQFADLISRLARLGKDVEIIIRVVGDD